MQLDDAAARAFDDPTKPIEPGECGSANIAAAMVAAGREERPARG